MAKSFWSKRNPATETTNYIRSVDAVSRPMAILLTLVGIVIIGGVLFGIFQGARWSFTKLSGNDIAAKPKNTISDSAENEVTTSNTSSTTPTPSVTVTSSTSTTTANSQATSVPKTNTTQLPQTGPTSNATIFVAVLVISYFLYRKKTLSADK